MKITFKCEFIKWTSRWPNVINKIVYHRGLDNGTNKLLEALIMKAIRGNLIKEAEKKD